MEFEIGKKYTTFEISSFMACSVKREIVIKDKDSRGTIFALRGKRKRYYTKCDKDVAVFEGWDLPLKADSDGNSYCGNALLNFVGTIEFVRDWIENKNLNPELDKSLVVATTQPTNDEKTWMVYPEEAERRGNVVAQTILKKQLITA